MDSRFAKGEHVRVRYISDEGVIFDRSGEVAGYEFRGRQELHLRSQGKLHRVPLDSIREIAANASR